MKVAKLTPACRYFQWLSYGAVDKDYFQHREFSFTLKDDIYVRYKSFADRAEMEKGALLVCLRRSLTCPPGGGIAIKDMCPYKIDIGAVFSGKARGGSLPALKGRFLFHL